MSALEASEPAQESLRWHSATRGEQFSMVDQDSGTYRPRRAFIEPDVEPAPPLRPAQPARNGNGRAPIRPASVEGRASTRPAHKPVRPPVEEDQPKPLYRDDARLNGSSRPTPRVAPRPADPPTQETLMTPANLAPRRPAGHDDETTTILPRSRPTKHRTQALDAIDDYDDDERRSLGHRGKLALIIGSVAAVIVIGLLIGYAVRSAVNQPKPDPAPTAGGNSNGAAQPPGQIRSAALSDDFMLSPSQAKAIDRDQNWKVASTQRGATENGPTPACFGGEPPEGQPTPQQELVRVLKGNSGKNAPLALHAATSYSSPDEATQAYAIAAKTLGGCAVTGLWIESGHLVSGIGDQAAGVVVMERAGKNWRAHSVVLNRSGAVVNVVDAVQPSEALAVNGVAKALGQVNTVQCRPVGGDCGNKPRVEDGPPPLGGDEPGFFASGDLPPVGPKVYPWVATEVEAPKKEFKGSGCESVNWETEQAKSKSSRVYLIQESGKNFFGLNEIVLTTKNAKAAGKLVDRIKSNLSRCKSRQLTATVSKARKVTSVGAQKTTVSGWTTVVSQKSTQGTAKYRVGIVSAGPKVVYTFLNPRAEYDFTNHQWNVVAVRGGERATQVD